MPGPTARTLPRWGFSLAVSGRTIPPAVFSSASICLTTTRSSRGRIPKFRLPDAVVDEESDYILNLGIDFEGGKRIDSMKALLAEDFDAIFVGSGAPRGRELDIPGRKEAAKNIHIGIDWLSSVSFGHIDQDRQARHRAGRRQHRDGLLPHLAPPRRRGRQGDRALRLRGDEGVALGKGRRGPRGHPDPQFPGAEGIHPRQRQADRRHVREGQGRVRRQGPPQSRSRPASRTSTSRATTCWSRSARRTRFPGSSATVGIEFDKWDMPKVDPKTMASTNPKVFFGGDAAFGPKNIIWAVAHGHDAALSIHKLLLRRGHHRTPAARRRRSQPEDGHPRVELRQRHSQRQALQGAASRQGDRAEGHPGRGRARL